MAPPICKMTVIEAQSAACRLQQQTRFASNRSGSCPLMGNAFLVVRSQFVARRQSGNYLRLVNWRNITITSQNPNKSKTQITPAFPAPPYTSLRPNRPPVLGLSCLPGLHFASDFPNPVLYNPLRFQYLAQFDSHPELGVFCRVEGPERVTARIAERDRNEERDERPYQSAPTRTACPCVCWRNPSLPV